MKDERFTNLEKDIIRSVGRVLSSQEMNELKNSIFSAVDQVEKVANKAARQADETVRRVNSRMNPPTYKNGHSGGRRYSNESYTGAYATPNYTNKQPAVYRNLRVKGATRSGLWLAGSICGILFSTLAIPLAAISATISGAGSALLSIAAPLATMAGSIVSTVFAGKSISRIGRFKKYLKTLGSHPMYTVQEIAEGSHIHANQVSSDLPKFLDAVALPFAKLDEEKTCLILDRDTYQQYLDLKENHRKLAAEEEERKARLAADPNAAAVEEMKKNGTEYLKKIRLANDALPEENISNKLDKLEDICRRIFSYVEQNPSKLPQIRKMMSYYLPMTLKLVEAYVQLENHSMATTSVAESKEEIHSALDKINLAFENLYNRLMENDLMDLSADISVLQTMLAQEGLTDHTNNLNSK